VLRTIIWARDSRWIDQHIKRLRFKACLDFFEAHQIEFSASPSHDVAGHSELSSQRTAKPAV
jgi:hypothetical protein